jgi:tRNA nucleotidyltransferase/poly(A) polymerase
VTSLAAELERHPEVARLRGPLARAGSEAAVYLVGGAVRDLCLLYT